MSSSDAPLSMAVADPERIGSIIGSRTHVRTDPLPQGDYVQNLLRMSQTADIDVCEMPLVSLLQAVAVGLPVRVLPVVMLRRAPHLYWVGRPGSAPDDLGSLTTGVRSWAQTTGVWVRAVLRDQYGIEPARWVTTEEERYAEFPPPPSVRRIADPGGLDGLLDTGVVQALVAASAATGQLQPLLADPAESAVTWAQANGITPINHVLICTADVARDRLDEVREICRALRDEAIESGEWAAGDAVMARRPVHECFDRDQILRSVEYLAPKAVAQRVLTRDVDLADLFAF